MQKLDILKTNTGGTEQSLFSQRKVANVNQSGKVEELYKKVFNELESKSDNQIKLTLQTVPANEVTLSYDKEGKIYTLDANDYKIFFDKNKKIDQEKSFNKDNVNGRPNRPDEFKNRLTFYIIKIAEPIPDKQ